MQRRAPTAGNTGLFLGLVTLAAYLDGSGRAAPPPHALRRPAAPPARPTAPPAGPTSPAAPVPATPPAQAETPPAQPETPAPPQRAGSSWARPFEGSYAASLASAIIGLAPFIVVTTAYAMFTHHVAADTGASRTALSIIAGLSTAGYAFGALLGGDMVQRFRQRWLFFGCELLFAIGCLLTAVAHGPALYAAGRVLAGLATGMLLVVALPPVIQKFPAAKLPYTVIAVNIGFFGAVCIGPLLGGWVEAGHHWRWFFGALGAIAVANLGLAILTLPDEPPLNPDVRFDHWALLLGFAGVVLPFWASGELSGHGFASARFAAPMFAGLVCFAALLLVEYHQQEPLSPVKKMWNTQSITGTLVAMIGGGVFVSFLELGERFHMQVAHQSPLATGILFWPLAVGALLAAGVFGVLVRTRWLPVLVFAGMLCICGGGALLLGLSTQGSRGITLGAAGLLGLGAGATVAPGLYLAGFPLPSRIIGRVFALVELVRSLADYVIAPVIREIAVEASGKQLDAHGVHLALWIALWLLVAFTAIITALYLLGRGGLPKPDLEAWLGRNQPAIVSTPLLARLRRTQS